jgi:3',5'-cyclic AMP phosphodiesterase CpdA
MLDSNRSIGEQAVWLEDQLKNTDATWKIAVYHHPAYSSSPNRDNKAVREMWGALFDKYHVDLALQGHDHAYLRTYPMRNQERVETPAEGTVYIVSVSGTKFYEQGEFAYTQFGMTNVATYQVLDIKIDGNRLEYGAFDVEGQSRDTFVIQK